ncbi:MAG: alpha/beta hydrolase [Candidatus Dormibacteraeota bacterium]|nr:alpha/beta hydrolase [Candidatus Dormibacteraeota bacterium]
MPLDPQVRTMLDQLSAMDVPSYPELGVAGAREMAELAAQLGPPPEPVEGVEDRSLDGPAGPVPVRIYRPGRDETGSPAPLLVYLHGGGFVIGSLETADRICRRLANAARLVVVSIGYHLAPEHPFPAAVEDAYAATRWVWEQASELGGDRGRVAIGGESAGANLAAVAALLARERGGPALAFQLLVYPTVDMAADYPSRTENGQGYLLSLEEMRWYLSQYSPDGVRPEDFRMSPLRAPSHAGLPPALVITAEFDPLRDEGEAYAEKLRAAGVPVRTSRYAGMVHGFFGMSGLLDRADEAVQEAAQALQEALVTAGGRG